MSENGSYRGLYAREVDMLCAACNALMNANCYSGILTDLNHLAYASTPVCKDDASKIIDEVMDDYVAAWHDRYVMDHVRIKNIPKRINRILDKHHGIGRESREVMQAIADHFKTRFNAIRDLHSEVKASDRSKDMRPVLKRLHALMDECMNEDKRMVKVIDTLLLWNGRTSVRAYFDEYPEEEDAWCVGALPEFSIQYEYMWRHKGLPVLHHLLHLKELCGLD